MQTPKNIDDLRSLSARGTLLTYRFFLDYLPPADGTITNACLSQWWPCLFKVDDHYYSSAEHFMMHQKAVLFGDKETAARIIDCDHPFEAKMLGRAVRNYNDQLWCSTRFDLVVRGNIAKFTQKDQLLRFLLATDTDILAETSPTDLVWGTGFHAEDPIATQPEKWPGQNLLGFALMQTRDILLGRKPTQVLATTHN